MSVRADMRVLKLYRCEAEGFRSEKGGVAEAKLLATLEKYFQGVPYEANGKVRCTQMPPIYFQHRGHSMTIVGLERRTSGVLELLVFDPMFRAPAAMTQLAELKQPSCLNRRNNQVHVQGQGNGRENKPMASLYKSAEAAMKLYRRGHRYLRRYTEFEILKYVTRFFFVLFGIMTAKLILATHLLLYTCFLLFRFC